MTHKESEDVFDQVSRLGKQIKELEVNSMKQIDLVNAKQEIERNMEQIMEKLFERVTRLIKTLEENLPKSDNVT